MTIDSSAAHSHRSSPTSPIGVFDSGVGGLSILGEIQRHLPNERLIYYADSAHCPYGSRTPADIQSLSTSVVRFLLDLQVKLVVVACNTASVAALSHLRESFPIPFVGVVPAVKPAAEASLTRSVVVLATPATFQGQMFDDLVKHYAPDVEVVRQVCPGLVEIVEQGETCGPEAKRLLREYLKPVAAHRSDTVVLGCTHYPHLRPLIEELVGPEVHVVDSGAAIARQVVRVLDRDGLTNPNREPGDVRYYTSGTDLGDYRRVISRLTRTVPEFVAKDPRRRSGA